MNSTAAGLSGVIVEAVELRADSLEEFERLHHELLARYPTHGSVERTPEFEANSNKLRGERLEWQDADGTRFVIRTPHGMLDGLQRPGQPAERSRPL